MRSPNLWDHPHQLPESSGYLGVGQDGEDQPHGSASMEAAKLNGDGITNV